MIRPVEFQGVVQRNQDMATMNQNENNKTFIHQENAMNTVKQEVEVKIRDVNQKDNPEHPSNHADAKEKGNNEYEGDGGRKRKRLNTRGTVTIKEQKNFDVKI